MKELTQNDKISIYGNCNIRTINKKTQNNICICIENQKVKNIGDYIYNLIQEQYKNINYNFIDNNIKIKTTKIMLNDEIIVNPNSTINIYGQVIDCIGIPWNNGKRYDFEQHDIKIDEIFKCIEELYDFYISEFDTEKKYLKFEIKKIMIKD